MILVKLSDFKGQYGIPDAIGVYTSTNVQSFIDKYEKQYLDQLLGLDLSNKIIAYLAANRLPDNPDYNFIIDPFQFQEPGGGCCANCIHNSKGMKAFLVAAITYEYISDNLQFTQVGAATPQAETATEVNVRKNMRLAEKKYNGLLDTSDAIQWYCWNNSDKYPTFQGQRFVVKLADVL